jgi:hypothetical protein
MCRALSRQRMKLEDAIFPCRMSRAKDQPSQGGLPWSVANPSTIDKSTPRLHGLGCAIAAPALNIRTRCRFGRMVRLCGMNLPGVFVVGCRSVGADAAGSVSGRPALGGICFLCSHEQKHSDDDPGHTLAFYVKDSVCGSSTTPRG